MKENQRQYEVIEKSLEILHGMKSIVDENPRLRQLQRDLEEANYQSATKLPLYSAFFDNQMDDEDDEEEEELPTPTVEDISNANNVKSLSEHIAL